MRGHSLLSLLTAALLLVGGAGLLSPQRAAAASTIETLPATGLWSENSITLPDGDVVVSVLAEGLKRIDRRTGTVTALGSVKSPGGLVLRGGTLYVASGADPTNVVLRRASIVAIDLATGSQRTVLDRLPFINGLGILRDGSLVFTATVDFTLAGVYRTTPDHASYRRINTSIPTPNGLTVGPDDTLYVGSTSLGTITRLNPQTQAHSVLSGWMPLIDDLSYGPDGQLYAATNIGKLIRVNPQTGSRHVLASGLLGATSAKTYDATRVVVTSIPALSGW